MDNYYELHYDMEEDDAEEAKGRPFIFADESNMDSLDYGGTGAYSFSQVIEVPHLDMEWPEVEFTYDSRESDRESDYLNNINVWPVIHRCVARAFEEAGIKGVRYYPVVLRDRATGKANDSYVAMYVEEYIDAYDMEKSRYRYIEKYNIYSFLPGDAYMDRRNCRGHDIFRPIKEDVVIIVSEKVRQVIMDNGFTGFGMRLMK